MSVDLKSDVVAPEVQAFLNAFDRLSNEAKRDAVARLLRKAPPSVEAEPAETVDVDDLDWGEITDEARTALVAEAFEAMDREEEQSS